MLRRIATDWSGADFSANDLKNLKKRKLVDQKTRKSYRIEKGSEFNPVRQKRYADISRGMLGQKEGNSKEESVEVPHWSGAAFKEVNLSAMGAPIQGGSLHPLLKVRTNKILKIKIIVFNHCACLLYVLYILYV
jgi:phenylalanyl-tRNA synthetase alpha chain